MPPNAGNLSGFAGFDYKTYNMILHQEQTNLLKGDNL